MERYEWKGDFLGFTFDGVHSSSLNIVRTSDGSRYNEEVIPEQEEKTIKVPGRDETYYFGTEYRQKNFEIKIAFDEMNETQYRQLKQITHNSELKELILDEYPHKVYMAKCNNFSINYICFDGEYERFYKGEGTLNFVAYYPFAQSRFLYAEDYTPSNIPEWHGIQDNKKDWLKSSRIPYGVKNYSAKIVKSTDITETQTVTHNLRNDDDNLGRVLFFKNPGDKEANIKIIITNSNWLNTSVNYKVALKKVINDNIDNPEEIGYFIYSRPESIPRKYFVFDSNNRLLKRYNTLSGARNDRSGVICNDLIIEGDFFQIPPTEDNEYYYIELVPSDSSNNIADFALVLDYKYIYY